MAGDEEEGDGVEGEQCRLPRAVRASLSPEVVAVGHAEMTRVEEAMEEAGVWPDQP